MADTSLIPGTTSATAPAVIEHPLYAYFAPLWRKLAHAVEGIAGFADGTYLIAHPREYLDHDADAPSKPTKKLRERRALARYENWPLTLLTLLSGGLFRKPPTRRAGDENAEIPHPLMDWWDDVDGLGTPIDDYLQRAWKAAAVFGHVFLIMDRPSVAAATAADAPRLYLRTYTPLDVPDWLVDDKGALTQVALMEVAPRTQIGQRSTGLDYTRVLMPDGYELRGANVDKAGQAPSGPSAIPGVLPVVVLYARRRPLLPVLGQSVLGDPQLYIDDYNLCSEKRELLRKQTFSTLNIPLGTGDGAQPLDQAQAMLGSANGTTNVLFTALPAQILSPPTDNVDAYEAEREKLARSMFRMSGLPWEGDSKDAESADSRKIKREDLNQVLGLFAAELEVADVAIARLWMRATHGDRWEDEWTTANVTVAWPRSFDADDLDQLIARAQAAIGLGLGTTAQVRLKTQIVQQLLPNQTAEDKQAIAQELQQEVDDEAAHEQAMREARTAAMSGAPRMSASAAPDTSSDGPDSPDPSSDSPDEEPQA